MAYGTIVNTHVTAQTGKASHVNQNYAAWIAWTSDGSKDINVNAGTLAKANCVGTCSAGSSVTFVADVLGSRSLFEVSYGSLDSLTTLKETILSGTSGFWQPATFVTARSHAFMIPRTGSVVGLNTAIQCVDSTSVKFLLYKNGASWVSSKVHSTTASQFTSTEAIVFARGAQVCSGGDLISVYLSPTGASGSAYMNLSIDFQSDD